MKNSFDDGIKRGKYKEKRKKKRLQGETIKLKTKNNFKVLGVITLALICFLFVFSAVVSGLVFTNCITYNGFLLSQQKAHATTIGAKSYVVMESSSGRVLESDNADEKLPVASLTKIMTALVAIENTTDYNSLHSVPDGAVGIEGTSMHLAYGEKVSVMDLLYGLMLASGNDSAEALAEIVAGSSEEFVIMMNKKAEALGLTSTNFENPHGLHSTKHYSTARDFATLTVEAMKNSLFREIVQTKNKEIAETNKSKTRKLKNKQKLLWDETLLDSNITVTGVKSGFTPEAGRCLVTSAVRDGMEVVVVVLNSPEMFEVSAKALKNAFDKYSICEILKPKNHIASVDVVGGDEKKSVNLYHDGSFSYPLSKMEESLIKVNYNYPSLMYAPVTKDQVVGEVEVALNGEKLYTSEIKTIEEVKNNSIFDNFLKIIRSY